MADRPPDEVGPAPSPRRWWVGPLLIGGAVGLVVAGVLTLVLARRDPAIPSIPSFPSAHQLAWAPGERPAPGFDLRDQTGHRVSLSSFHGHPVVLAFLNSLCTDICPVEGRQLASLAAVLPPDRLPVILAVSVNPDDTPATATEAAGEWGWAGLSWHWLLGSRADLSPVWRSYGIRAGAPDAHDQVTHTGALFLIDAAGDVRAAYTIPIPMPMLVGDIEQVEGG